ncbi:ParA family protein [Synechocystis sp. FACHB-383]|uniref:ParA family protein n=1 Tax=Synechocystis sp. FACHB-383 TaxID=2692864 RepID=UPI00168931BC|nr:ParA family protein [Synechocystis sp. FACHB-383]MBD2652872.1 ParA family protein [Synechocystis sp. FACHB-383]
MIITVTAFKGGVGKTTSSIHLAAYLNNKAPTILIDGDLNRSALLWASHQKLDFPVVDEREGLKAARNYEHIVVDTPARPEIEEIRSLAKGCDLMVLPTSPDALSMGALQANIQTFKQLNIPNFRILMTIVPPKPSTAGIEAKEYLQSLGLPVFKRMITRYAAFPKAALEGCVVRDVKGDRYAGAGWNDYKTVGGEIYG